MKGSAWFFHGLRSAGAVAILALALGTFASSQEGRMSALQREMRFGPEGEKDNGREDVAARAAYELLIRVPEGEDRIPQERYLAALEHMRRMPRNSIVAGGQIAPTSEGLIEELNLPTWSPLGPTNKGGRTRALVIDPVTPNTMYAGGVAGGVFKSTDGGANWTPMSDLIPRIAISSLAIAPTSPSTLYAGTGEIFAGDGVEGLGIFKSTDSGVTWPALASTLNNNFKYVADIVVSPLSANRVYAATWNGVYRSLDAGVSWTQVVNRGYCNDLAIRTDTATDTVFATCGFSSGSAAPEHRRGRGRDLGRGLRRRRRGGLRASQDRDRPGNPVDHLPPGRGRHDHEPLRALPVHHLGQRGDLDGAAPIRRRDQRSQPDPALERAHLQRVRGDR